MALATMRPSSRPTSTSELALPRANSRSAAGSFHGRVRPHACHSAMTSASSPGAIARMVRLVALSGVALRSRIGIVRGSTFYMGIAALARCAWKGRVSALAATQYSRWVTTPMSSGNRLTDSPSSRPCRRIVLLRLRILRAHGPLRLQVRAGGARASRASIAAMRGTAELIAPDRARDVLEYLRGVLVACPGCPPFCTTAAARKPHNVWDPGPSG